MPPVASPDTSPSKASSSMPTKLFYESHQIVVTRLSSNFQDATEISTVSLKEMAPQDVLVRNRYVGVNASDVNLTAGKYYGHDTPPFPAGFEAIGIVEVSGERSNVPKGSFVTYLQEGAYAEYMVVPSTKVHIVPQCEPEFLALVLSAPTAMLALDKFGNLHAGETVLISAAAGGVGHFAVQLAKMAGCKVIGTCSSEEKCDVLKSLGCDRPVNYTKENLRKVIETEFKGRVDVVFESIGKQMFDLGLDLLAPKGRMLVVGQLQAYLARAEDLHKDKVHSSLPLKVMSKSVSLCGFFLPHFINEAHSRLSRLLKMYAEGRLKVVVDKGENSQGGAFVGLGKVATALEYLYQGQNIGKVVVELQTAPVSPIKMVSPIKVVTPLYT